MHNKNRTLWLFCTAMVFMLSACQPERSTPTQSAAPAIINPLMVSATAKVVPEQFAVLSINTTGVVAEVPVSKGDYVGQGQLLIHIKGGEQAQAAITAAQLELTNAQVALNVLHENTNLLAANALKTAEDSEDALEDLHNTELQEALALQAIADAQKAIENTERIYRYTITTADQSDIDVQSAQVILAEDILEKALEDFEPYADKPETNLSRAHFLAQKAAAEQAYEAAVRKLNALRGTGSPADIDVAEAGFATARAQLSEAERHWERVQAGPTPGEIALLEAQIENAYRDYEIYSAGPDPNEVAVLTARVVNAEAQLAAAQAALNDLQLLAPFDGVVSELNINPNEWVAPGQPVLTLADLDNLQVETTDLGEIDVALIQIGDTAMITFDALPELTLDGTVISIAPKASPGSGVNYTVVLAFDERDPRLRWGMTAFVDIELDQ